MTSLLQYIHLYGLILGVAVVLGYTVAENRLKKHGFAFPRNAVIFIILSGVIGARIYHVLTDFSLYWPNAIVNIFFIWEGGLGIYGGVVGGLFGLLVWYAWKGKHSGLPLLVYTDIGVLGVSLAQSVGRWANFVNQEVYGKPTLLPWGIFIDPQNRAEQYLSFDRYHPLFLYESIGAFALWIVLMKVSSFSNWKIGMGKLTALYLLWYAFLRFILDFLRINPATFWVLTIGQWCSIGIWALVLFIVFGKKLS